MQQPHIGLVEALAVSQTMEQVQSSPADEILEAKTFLSDSARVEYDDRCHTKFCFGLQPSLRLPQTVDGLTNEFLCSQASPFHAHQAQIQHLNYS